MHNLGIAGWSQQTWGYGLLTMADGQRVQVVKYGNGPWRPSAARYLWETFCAALSNAVAYKVRRQDGCVTLAGERAGYVSKVKPALGNGGWFWAVSSPDDSGPCGYRNTQRDAALACIQAQWS